MALRIVPLGHHVVRARSGHARRYRGHPGRPGLRGQPPRLDAVRPVRAESRVDRAAAQRGRGAARQPRHHRRLPRRCRTGAARAGRPVRTAQERRRTRLRRRRRRDPAGDRAGLAVRLRSDDRAAELRRDQSAQAAGAGPHPAQDAYIRALRRHALVFGPDPPAPARPGWRSRTRCSCSSARKSTASCCRARRSRPASGSAFCRATCARRSIPICGPIYDALYDLMDARIVERAHAERRDRDRAARLHARTHAVECGR